MSSNGNTSHEVQDKTKQLEGKLATLTVINGALQNENESLRQELAKARTPSSTTEAELHELQEEFTRRLAAADRTITSLREKNEALRSAATAASKGGSVNEARLQDREHYISSLQAEGEALARKNGELEATVRKLRASVRQLETERDRTAGRLAALEASLASEQERAIQATQAAAVQMEEMDAEIAAVRQQAASQIAAAKKEAAAAREAAAAEAARSGAAHVASAVERETALSANLADLRAEYEAASLAWFTREEGLRREISRLENRIHDLEDEKVELVASTSENTRPLSRQVESMAASLAAQQAAHAATERQLMQRLREAEEAARAAVESERNLKGRLATSEAALAAAKTGLESATAQASELRAQLDAEKRRSAGLATERDNAEERLAAARRREEAARQKADSDRQEAQERCWEAEGRVRSLEADVLHWQEMYQQSLRKVQSPSRAELPISRSASQTAPMSDASPSPGRGEGIVIAADESSPSEQHDLDGLIAAPASPRTAAQHLSRLRSGSGAGPGAAEAHRVIFLEKRVAAAEAAADSAREELLRACERAESANAAVSRCRELERELKECQARYDMALELLGERNEHVDKLEDDIREMKEIFHGQLSLMADQLTQARNAAAAGSA
ncbi:probable TATA element modulatory factor [Coccomyxa sp. Obi]|nr:probable TATA element modulatory factor [Coccomyxa sp. Obi]